MEITEVRIKLTSGKNEKLRAFCSITIDNDFVIRDLKVIEGAKGAFVAMPSRKLMARCASCGGKNHYRAPYCNECGGRLSPEKLSLDGRRKLHADVAHPINSGCRESIQQRVLAHYEEEKEKAKDPNYRPADLDDFDDDFFDEEGEVMAGAEGPRWEGDVPAEAPGLRSAAVVESRREAGDSWRERPPEENEWEEESREGDFRHETALEPASGSAGTSADATAQQHTRDPVGSAARSDDAARSPFGAPDRTGGRRGDRPRQRTGGRRRRGRDPRRDAVPPGERNRLLDSPQGERSSEGAGRERSPLAVDFDDLRSGRTRSGRPGSGRPGAGQGGGWRDARRDEAGREPRFRERGGERAADASRVPLRSDPRPSRIPEKRLPDEADVEPEDNFGAGLFS